MSGTDDLVAAAQPYLCTEIIKATAGMSWEWGYTLKDDAGTLVDWTGCSGTAIIYDSAANSLLAGTVTFPSAGKVKVTATPAATAALNNAGKPSVGALHEVEITTASARKFMIVGAGGGTFTILNQAG